MKLNYLTGVLSALVLVVGLAAPAAAMTGAMVAVPFEFVAGETTLPAGVYTVERMTGTDIFSLKDADGRRHMLTTRNQGGSIPRSGSSLVFIKSQDQTTLSEIRLSGSASASLTSAPEGVPMIVALMY